MLVELVETFLQQENSEFQSPDYVGLRKVADKQVELLFEQSSYVFPYQEFLPALIEGAETFFERHLLYTQSDVYEDVLAQINNLKNKIQIALKSKRNCSCV